MDRYYTQALNFSSLMKGEELKTCSLQQSIAQRIHLALITNINEFRFDRKFGFIVWENDFENVDNINKWKDNMAKAVKELLENYESRLQNIRASFDLTEEEFRSKDNDVLKRIKRRVDIKINATLKKTNESFFFQELLYISPVWIE